MSFGECFEGIEVCTVSDVFGERVSEGGGSYWEGSVAPGSVLGSMWWSEEGCVRGIKGVGRVVAVAQIGLR